MGIVDAFLQAVDRFQQHPSLEYVWFRFLPDVDGAFFFPVEFAITRALKQRPIFRSADGGHRLPSQCIILTYDFRDEQNEPLIPEMFLPGGLHYLSESYDVRADGSHFERLGVRTMSNDDFLAGLKNMNHIICDQPNAWQESTCNRLYHIYRAYQTSVQQATDETAPATTPQSSRKQILDKPLIDIVGLCILPLSDGTWTSADSKGDIMFDSALVDIPRDLDLRVLSPIVKSHTLRYWLFRNLGVKQAIPKVVATKILELHRSASCPQSRESLIQHARFLFAYRFDKDVPRPTGVRVMDQKGDIAEGTEVHSDFPDVERIVSLTVLPPPARFLHADYLEEQDWWRWLRNEIGVKHYPRLVDDGDLSPEFLELSGTIDARRLLLLLKETWPQWEGSLSIKAKPQLANIEVICKDGSKHPLKATYLARGAVATFSDLPFLPISDPEHRDWDFLLDLGVTYKVDGDFFIKRLVRIKDGGDHDDTTIKAMYEQIQARFDDNPLYIR
jgi:hypothetical protein